MWKPMAQLVIGSLVAAQMLASPVTVPAEDAPPAAKSAKPAKNGKRNVIRGAIKAMDSKVAMTLTLGGKKEDQTLQLTSRTRLYKDGKPATLADLAVGDEVNASARETAEGKWEAISIRWGAKAQSAPAPKRPKKSPTQPTPDTPPPAPAQPAAK